MKMFTFCLFMSLCICRIICEKQFTAVVDTTISMAEELNILRSVIKYALNNGNLNFEKYTLITMNDPYISKPLEYPFTRESFLRHLERLKPNTDQGCHRNAADGIGVALEHTSPGSTIYVFTDASTRNSNRDIASICKSKNVKVEIFLTGNCGRPFDHQPSDVEIYTEIAKACSGKLFKLEPIQLHHIYNYIMEQQQNDWSQVSSQEIAGYQKVTIRIEPSSESIICILAYGNNPSIQGLSTNKEFGKLTPIVNTKYVQIYKKLDVSNKPLTTDMNIGCQGTTVITTFHKFKPIFDVRFSPRLLNDYQSIDMSTLREVTSSNPVPGHHNIILLLTNEGYEYEKILISTQNKNETLHLEKIENDIYYTSAFFAPYNHFDLTVTGRYGSQQNEFSENLYNLKPQENIIQLSRTEVKLFPPRNTTILYGSNITLICRVKGYPEPLISWENDHGETFYPDMYYLHTKMEQLSFLDITYISEDMDVTCKAKNDESSALDKVFLTVYRPKMLEIVVSPEDTTIEYGETGELKCVVNGYPEPEINWYHNDTLIDFNTSDNFINDRRRLVIRNMTIDDVGFYDCVAINEIKTEKRTAELKVSGIESPEINLDTEVILEEGKYKNIECSLFKGSPYPTITWAYKASEDLDFNENLPDEVDIDDDQLIITKAVKTQAGIYKCTAENFVGQDSKEFNLRVYYAPKIENNEENITIAQGDTVQLECKVDAEPTANVIWKKAIDGGFVYFNETPTTDEYTTHKFIALSKDAGHYICSAENELGVDEKNVFVNVIVCPKIKTPDSTNISKRLGESLDLRCSVIEGSPTPMTSWGFIPKNPTSGFTHLSSGLAESYVKIPNLTKKHEGIYQCIAENEFDKDRIRIEVSVN